VSSSRSMTVVFAAHGVVYSARHYYDIATIDSVAAVSRDCHATVLFAAI
jgi:hypothetical protein